MLHPKITKDGSTSGGSSSGQNSKETPRKRVARACDRCRLKKGKCDGKEQCAKCVSADVMCIYTDRKPPQHKLISPAVAEALQSENLTLKKATIIIFKQLIEARGGQLPVIEGVDWASEKVANGKSGRALNYIISREARVDNRISTEEIANYDSDTQMLDPNSRTCPNSPASRQSSPQSTVGDMSPAFWGGGASGAELQLQQQHSLASHKKRKATKYGYPGVAEVDVTAMPAPASASPYLNPGLLSVESLAPAFTTPPTPPTGLDALDYLPREQQQLQWSNQRPQQQQQQQARFYEERYLLQRYAEEQAHIQQQQQQQQLRSGAAGPVPGPTCDNSMPWTTPEYFQYLQDNKDYGK
ncbi:hypothetical protein BZA05DRAFT_236614 [Tricharina praecox]|uniref:uncharacterized protein n=1 Tax=Tricharina praecox TaxID=43433 RepID=UPI0022205188|nr:uncharacterized protein BZA05DRAFT_236614 [Tricharina praecox]KAI5855304.1 hypothetical protein BZA05DRAFT_236614 [Tricharina praecox]